MLWAGPKTRALPCEAFAQDCPGGAASPLRHARRWTCCLAAGPRLLAAFIAMDLASRLFSPYDLNWRVQPAARDPGRKHRLRAAGARRSRCSSPPPTCVPVGVASFEPRDHPGRPARLGLPAHPVPGGRDRRRGLLGRGYSATDDHASGAECEAKDIILVQINPVERAGTPRPPAPQRGFLQPVLLKELRMMALLRGSPIPAVRGRVVAGMRTHRIMAKHGRARLFLKLNAEWIFCACATGSARRSFLATHGEDLGRRSSPTSTPCWRACDAMGVLRVLLRAPVNAASAPRPQSGSRW